MITSISCLGVPLTLERVGGPQHEMLHPLNDPIKQFDADRCRETYVCFPVKRADDRGTHAEKKGPLQYVNPNRSGEEKQGCRNPGNETVLDQSKTPASRSP